MVSKSTLSKKEQNINYVKGLYTKKESFLMIESIKKNSNKKLKPDIIHNDVLTDEEIPQLSDTIEIESCMKDAIGYLKRNCNNWCNNKYISDDPNKETFSPCVCVVCDCFIIGTEEIKWISTDDLINQKKLLGSEELELFLGHDLPLLLKNQYSLADKKLKGLLLSPRARRIGNNYMICESCNVSLKN